MGRIAFVTDSTAGVPPDQIEKYSITVVPLQVIFGTEAFRDGIDLTQEQFFERLKAAKTPPTTSQPTVGDFEAAYRGLLADPEVTGIISVHLSSALSGTFSSAAQAAERVSADLGKPISVIDSLSAFMSEGLLAINGARAAQAGKGQDEIVEMLKASVPRTRLLVLVDTLEYLRRGGRIGGAQALLGSMLSIKPVLTLRHGRVEPLEKVRTRRKAMERIVEIAAQETKGAPCQVAIGDAAAHEDAAALGQMVREKLNVTEVFFGEVGPVFSTHTGPGTLGLVYLPVG